VGDLILPLFIVAMAVVAGLLQPLFFSGDNFLNLGRQIVPLMIISLGQAMAIIRGGLDLSLAAVMSLAGVAGVFVMKMLGMPAGISVMLLVGATAGTVSGFIIGYLRTTPLVVTLGMLSIAQAIALILAGGVPVYDVPQNYVDLVGFKDIAGIPLMTWIAAGAVLVSGSCFLAQCLVATYMRSAPTHPRPPSPVSMWRFARCSSTRSRACVPASAPWS